MTKTEFIDFIESSLDFLDSKGKETALAFIAEKFSLCNGDEEEKAVIEAFGNPNEFVEKFKADYPTFQKNKKKNDKTIRKYLDSQFNLATPTLTDEDTGDKSSKKSSDKKENKKADKKAKDKKEKKAENKEKSVEELEGKSQTQPEDDSSKKNATTSKKKAGKKAEPKPKVEDVKENGNDSKELGEEKSDKKSKKKKSEQPDKKSKKAVKDSSKESTSEKKAAAKAEKKKAKSEKNAVSEEKNKKVVADILKKIGVALLAFKDNSLKPFFKKVADFFAKLPLFKKKSSDKGEAVLEPIDKANGLTAEEIDQAKAETLEKANSFYENEDEIVDEVNAEPVLIEEEEKGKKFKIPTIPPIVFPGLFNQFLPKDKYDKYTRLALLALLTLAVSPALIVAFGLVMFVYAAMVAFTLSVAVFFFAIMVVLVIIGIVELVHGFLLLFDSVAAALIEIGFGTVLFSIVIAIAALVHEFLFGIVPKWLKWISAIFIRYTKLLFCYLYGGKA